MRIEVSQQCVDCVDSERIGNRLLQHVNNFFYPAFTTLYEFEPPPSGGSEITHKDTPQSVGLLWTRDQPVAETST
jgi:hypothetical protein